MRKLIDLQQDLAKRFMGSSELAALPIRTRSKKAKIMVCEALGLPVPKSFAKTSPRFPMENLDISVQQANNFQLWNAALDPLRRYAFIVLDSNECVHGVHVVLGEDVAVWNSTGTETLKRQAEFLQFGTQGMRVIGQDTDLIASWIRLKRAGLARPAAANSPSAVAGPDGDLRTLEELGVALEPLLGTTIKNPGATQERLRGQELHMEVSRLFGYSTHEDSGQHPDIPHQVLELKLQTARTVDLGLVNPTSTSPLGPPFPDTFRHADTRYAVFGGEIIAGARVQLNSLVMVSGESFFLAFRRFGGLGENKKLQIHLPQSWWR